jgi:hypothetical protein
MMPVNHFLSVACEIRHSFLRPRAPVAPAFWSHHLTSKKTKIYKEES